jgi:diguanylate cyclase (GGDEF)-like protein
MTTISALAALEQRNGPALDKLRAGDLDTQALLVQLLTTSCLLEVSKLLSAGADLATFASGTLEVLSQFAPIDRCAIRIEAAGVPPTCAGLGETDEALDHELFAAALDGVTVARDGMSAGVLYASGEPVGYLAAFDLAEPVATSSLIEKLTQQISDGLTNLVEMERSRRRLAAAHAIELASRIDESYERDDLAEYVRAIAALPNAIGARLALRGSRRSGAVVIEAGVMHVGAPSTDPSGGSTMTTSSVEVDESLRLGIDLRWALPPAESEVAALTTSIEALTHALRRAERAARLADEAETDELTGLGNRRRALRVLSAARTRAERDGSSFSVLMFDLDHFKLVNDTLGHAAGDAVLVAFAAMLQQSIREDDRAARWGGEEFLLVCAETDQNQAEALARRLLPAVPVACAAVLPEGWRQTVSIGIASYPMNGDTPTAVVHAADDALYRAKHAGRDTAQTASCTPPSR